MINKFSFSNLCKNIIFDCIQKVSKTRTKDDLRNLALRKVLVVKRLPMFSCYFFVTKYLSGIIPKTKACLLCLLFILILSLC